MPGVPAVNVNFSPVPSTLDLKLWSLLTTVWGMSSPFVQVICVPAFTVSVVGEKLKLSILTSTLPAAPTGAAAGKPVNVNIPENAKERIQSVLLRLVLLVDFKIIFLPVSLVSGEVGEGLSGAVPRCSRVESTSGKIWCLGKVDIGYLQLPGSVPPALFIWA